MWGESRHIHITYFFINDILLKENVELTHFPVDRMIAALYTKPLQGSLFRNVREIVMGLTPFLEEDRIVNSEEIEEY